MGNGEASVEERGTTKNEPFGISSLFQSLLHRLDGTKPNERKEAGAIGESGGETGVHAFPFETHIHDATAQLQM